MTATVLRTSSPVRQELTFLRRAGVTERCFVVLAMLAYGLGLPDGWLVQLGDDVVVNESTGSMASIVFAAIAGVSLFILLPNAHLFGRLMSLVTPLTLVTIWPFVTTMWSDDPMVTLRRSLALIATFIFALFLAIRFTRREIAMLVSYATCIGVLINYAVIFGLPEYGQQSGRWDGVFTNKNGLGQFGSFAALCMVFAVVAWQRSKFIPILFLLASIGLTLGSQSKTALVSMMLIFLLIAVFQFFRARRGLFVASITGFIATSTIAALFATANLPLITEILDKDITLSGRTELWGMIVQEIKQSPILGRGYSSFWNGYHSPSHEILVSLNWAPPSAHNAALDYLLELGIVGLSLVVLYLCVTIWSSIGGIRDYPGLLGSWPAALMANQLLFSVTESGIIARSLPWLVTMAIVCNLATETSPPELKLEQQPDDETLCLSTGQQPSLA